MKRLSIVTALAIVGLAAMPTFAGQDTDRDNVYGRSTLALERTMRDRGIVTAGFEEWGGFIRAWVSDGTGGTNMVFFDPDTLEMVTPGRR